jgi:cytoskeletal protein CcmA (bactofilin family)
MTSSSSRMSEASSKGSVTIGEGVVIHGTIEASGKATVFGTLDGELTASEVVIGPVGRVAGRLTADVVDVQGEGPKELTARRSLVVRSSGRVSGNIRYGRLEVEPGAALDGTLIPVVEPSAETPSPAKPGVPAAQDPSASRGKK